MARIIVVGEAEKGTAELIGAYFSEQGYEVAVGTDEAQTREMIRALSPDLIILSVDLPPRAVPALCRDLRTAPRTSYLPIICLAGRDQYDEMMAVLEAGADDCVATPFDIEEFSLRVNNAVARRERENLTDPRSGLPGSRLIEDYVAQIAEVSGWAYLLFKVEHFEAFRDANGFVAADQVLHATAGVLRQVVVDIGGEKDFIGHPGDNVFVVITFAPDVDTLVETIKARFDEMSPTHYSFMDREVGYLTLQQADQVLKVPFMMLRVERIPPERLFQTG